MNVLFLTLAFLYGILSFSVWRFWRRAGGSGYPVRRELAVLAPILLLHGTAVFLPVAAGFPPGLGFGGASAMVAWLMLLLYWCGSFYYPLKGVQLLLYPLSAAMLLLAALWPGVVPQYSVYNIPFMLHVSAALAAYGLFGITTLTAVLVVFLDNRLRSHRMGGLMSSLPPLLSIEKMMFLGTWAGFVLLTLALVAGVFFYRMSFVHSADLAHKVVFAVLSWLMYGSVLWSRYRGKIRGRRAAVRLIGAFVLLLLAYMGSRFVVEVILHKV